MSAEISRSAFRFGDIAVDDALSCVSCQRFLHQTCFLSSCLHILCADCIHRFSESVNVNASSQDHAQSSFEGICPKCDKSTNFCIFSLLDLVRNMVKNVSENGDVACANCDQHFRSETMFFCETCKQSLCDACKVSTHSARMFAAHHIIPSTDLSAVIKCCNHPEEVACIANCAQNEFVCVKCFSDFSDGSKSSCAEIHRAIEDTTSLVSEGLSLLQAQQTIVRGRMLENESEMYKIQSTCSERKQAVSEFADHLVEEIRKTEHQLISELDKDVESKQGILQKAKTKSEEFIRSVYLYSSIFDIVKSITPNGNYLKLCCELNRQFEESTRLKSDCLSQKVLQEKNAVFNLKVPFKKVFNDLTSDTSQPQSCLDVDSLRLQNLALMRSIKQDPSQFQKLLDLTTMTGSPLRLLSPGGVLKDPFNLNHFLNSSSSVSSGTRGRLCQEAEQSRSQFRLLQKLYDSSVSKVQSLQLDVTRRKVYPKKSDADRLSLELDKFSSLSTEFLMEVGPVRLQVESKRGVAVADADCLEEDVEYTLRKLAEWERDCKDMQQKKEQIKQVFKCIKPYILSVTKQKEKSNTRLTPTAHLDHLDDLKRNVTLDDSVSEQRIQAIEAMYKSQNMERPSVNNSEIQKELQMQKQKLKKPKCNTSDAFSTEIACASTSSVTAVASPTGSK